MTGAGARPIRCEQRSGVNDPFNLARFAVAQAPIYHQVLSEIASGEKRSHWMWYIFPQYDGLGSSLTAMEFAIKSTAEASAYLRHDVLGPRLVECAEALLAIEGRTARSVFGADDVKLRSSATLFARVSPAGSPFHRLLDRFFAGQPDGRTLKLIESDTLTEAHSGGNSGPT